MGALKRFECTLNTMADLRPYRESIPNIRGVHTFHAYDEADQSARDLKRAESGAYHLSERRGCRGAAKFPGRRRSRDRETVRPGDIGLRGEVERSCAADEVADFAESPEAVIRDGSRNQFTSERLALRQ